MRRWGRAIVIREKMVALWNSTQFSPSLAWCLDRQTIQDPRWNCRKKWGGKWILNRGQTLHHFTTQPHCEKNLAELLTFPLQFFPALRELAQCHDFGEEEDSFHFLDRLVSEDLQLACYLLANILDSWCEIEGNSIPSVSYKSATREAISVSNESPKMYSKKSNDCYTIHWVFFGTRG